MYIYLTFLISFYSIGTSIFLYDYFDKENWEKKKLQYKDIYPVVLKNSFIYVPLISIPYEKYFVSNEELGYLYLLFKVIFGILLIDLYFYICHRIMHIPQIYKWSHKLHHKHKEPIGIEALYLHWFDLYFGNILPIYLPVINTNLLIQMIWTFVIITNALITHTDLVDLFHKEHHLHFNCNYGLGYYMDRFFKTKRIVDKKKIL